MKAFAIAATVILASLLPHTSAADGFCSCPDPSLGVSCEWSSTSCDIHCGGQGSYSEGTCPPSTPGQKPLPDPEITRISNLPDDPQQDYMRCSNADRMDEFVGMCKSGKPSALHCERSRIDLDAPSSAEFLIIKIPAKSHVEDSVCRIAQGGWSFRRCRLNIDCSSVAFAAFDVYYYKLDGDQRILAVRGNNWHESDNREADFWIFWRDAPN